MNARLAISVGVLALVVTACAGAAPAPTPSAPPVTEPPATNAPDIPIGGPGGLIPGPGDPTDLVPKPGTVDPRPVNIEGLEARLNGDRIAVRATWTSGVEPCHVFDSVGVTREGSTITITIREGSGDVGAFCIEIAQQKSTVIDLGSFEPGAYTIQASQGSATPVEVVVP